MRKIGVDHNTLIVQLVLRVNWWQVLEEVEVSSVTRDDSERLM